MSIHKTFEQDIESLFNEIAEDLAETINGGAIDFGKGACHGQMVL